jgi:hypothetical protein
MLKSIHKTCPTFQDIANGALLTAVALKKLKLVKILLEGGAKVNQKGYDGKTALTVACSVLIEEFEHRRIFTNFNFFSATAVNNAPFAMS